MDNRKADHRHVSQCNTANPLVNKDCLHNKGKVRDKEVFSADEMARRVMEKIDLLKIT